MAGAWLPENKNYIELHMVEPLSENAVMDISYMYGQAGETILGPLNLTSQNWCKEVHISIPEVNI